MNKVVAVTGGGGFIGRRLITELVLAGYQVRVLTRNSQNKSNSSMVTYFQGDLVNSSEDNLSLFLEGVEVLYHCAAEILDESRMAAVNIEGTRKLAYVAKGRIKRWVQLSTIGVYGTYSVGTVTEETVPKPANLYESTKLAADLVVLDILNDSEVIWSILRPSIVYGAEMPNNSLRALIDTILNKHFFYIGKAGAVLPYIHVDDVVNSLIMCGEMEDANGEIFNLSGDVTVESFVQSIARIKCRQFYFPRLPEFIARSIAKLFAWYPHFPLTTCRIDALTRRVQYPTNKIRTKLGYVPVKSFYNGLKGILERNPI